MKVTRYCGALPVKSVMLNNVTPFSLNRLPLRLTRQPCSHTGVIIHQYRSGVEWGTQLLIPIIESCIRCQYLVIIDHTRF